MCLEATYGLQRDAIERMPWPETVKFIYDLQFNRHPIRYKGLGPTNGSEHVVAVQWSKSEKDQTLYQERRDPVPWVAVQGSKRA